MKGKEYLAYAYLWMGSHHSTIEQEKADKNIRGELQDQGFRVINIGYSESFEEQVKKYPEIFAEEA